MKLSTRTLQGLKDDAAVVDVHRDGMSEESALGQVTDFNDSFVYMSLFDENGLANGVAVFWRHDISRIRWGGNQREAVAALVRERGTRPSMPNLQLDSIESVLRSIRAAFGYVNVLIEHLATDVTFIGEIEEIDTESLLLLSYGTQASRDRSRLLLRLDDITRVDADSAYERSIHYLATGKMPQD